MKPTQTMNLSLTGVASPCRNCEDRAGGCHSSCVRYLEYRQAVARERAARKEDSDKETARILQRKTRIYRS